MRFVSVKRKNIEGTGIVHGDRAKVLWANTPAYPGSLDDLVKGGMAALQAAGVKLAAGEDLALSDVQLLAPLRRAPKLICIGLNYADHSKESGFDTPTYPAIFSRYNSSLMGHGAPMVRPKVSEQLDYEGELAVIVGKAGRHIPIESALEHVIGYSAFNDGSVAHITAQCGARAGAGRRDCVGHTGGRRHGAQAAAVDEAGRCV